MELRHLRAFIVVAEELHFGRAASRLFVSQAPLTRIINRLEAEIGTALFERSTRSVVLTSAGRAFLIEARAIVERARGLLDIFTRAAHGEVGVIRLAYVTSASLVPSFNAMLHRMRERLPSVHVQLIQASTVEALENLLMDRADIAFIRPWPQDHPPPGIGWNVFAQDHLVAVLPSNHRCAEGSSPLHISDLADERLIVYQASAGAGISNQIASLFSTERVRVNLVQVAPEAATIVGLVSAGMGVSILPSCFTSFRVKGVCYRAIEGPNTRSDLLVAFPSRGREPDPVVEQFLAIVSSFSIPRAIEQ